MPVTQTIEFRAVTGQTITAKLFAAGSDTEVASVTATEQTNRKGTYRAAFTDVAAGEYQLLAFNATPVPLASWWVTLTLTSATFQVYDRVDKDGITRNNWAALTVDHTSTGSMGEALSLILTAINTLTSRIPATLFSGITYLSRWLGAIAGKTADTTTRTEINATTGGASYNETTDSLEAIRDRGDTAWTTNGTSIMVTPVVAQVPVRVRDTDIETYIGDLSTIRIGIFSGEDAVDLSGFGDLEVCVQAKDGTDLDFIEMADLTIDGTDNNYVSWDPSGPSVATIRRGKWSLRKSSNKQVIAKGAWIISDAALEDSGS